MTPIAIIALGVVGLCVALYAAKRQDRPPLDWARIVMSVLFLIAASVPFIHFLALVLTGDARLGELRAEDYRFYGSFGLAALLGAFAVATLFAWRPAHFIAGLLFFGLWAALLFVDIAANALAGRVFRSAIDAVVEYGFRLLLLAVAVAGLVIELRCERGSQLSGRAKVVAAVAVWLAVLLILLFGEIRTDWRWNALWADPSAIRWREVLTVVTLIALAGFATGALWWRKTPSGTPAEGLEKRAGDGAEPGAAPDRGRM
jgi:hypothetical protein